MKKLLNYHIEKMKVFFLAGIDFRRVINFSKKNKYLKEKFWSEVQDNQRWSDSVKYHSLVMGTLESENGLFKFYVPEEVHSASYSVETRFQYFNLEEEDIVGDDIIRGVNISSHRPPYSYVRVDEIPLHVEDTNEIYNQYLSSIQNRTFNRYYHDDNSPVHYMKKSLISLAVFGEGNSLVKSNREFREKFYGFTDILVKVLPGHIGFERIRIESGEVVLKTQSGDFLIDAVSGGMGALIDLAWQIYMFKDNDKEFTVVIDEIENHLHPSMQREILPNLIEAFPKAQFIISTHSPFVVNSIKDSIVYALKYNENKRVTAFKLDFANKSKDAFDVLRDVLGVPVTMPLWLEDELNIIMSNFNEQLDLDSYKQLKLYLQNKGLEEYLPEMLQKFGGKVE